MVSSVGVRSDHPARGRVAGRWPRRRGRAIRAAAVAVAAAAVFAPVGPAVAASTASDHIGAAAWGFNADGALGDGSTTTRLTPVQMIGLTDGVTQVAAGGFHSVVLRSDGTVWTSGLNINGELGDGTTTDRSTPGPVPGLTNITQIAANQHWTITLRSDGTVWDWGDNQRGQLGDGTTTGHRTPARVPGLTGIIQVEAGAAHGMALRNDGTVWAWGNNDYGQLGDGTTTRRFTPAQVPGLTGVTQIAAGGAHSLALRGDGTVWSFGLNENGQLGDGTTRNATTAVQVAGLAGVAQIAAGETHSLALLGGTRGFPAGQVFAWGNNGNGQLGDGTTTDRHTPMRIPGLPPAGATTSVAQEPRSVTQIAAGNLHSLALLSDGTVWAWGSQTLGDGDNPNRNIPVKVTGLAGVRQISGGGFFSMAVRLLPPTN